MTTEPTPITEAPSAPAPARRKRAARKRKPSTRAPRTMAQSGITANLRAQLVEKVAPCPHCGSPQGNKSQMTRDIGISIISLNKFLKGGRVSSDTVDAVYEYLNRK